MKANYKSAQSRSKPKKLQPAQASKKNIKELNKKANLSKKVRNNSYNMRGK